MFDYQDLFKPKIKLTENMRLFSLLFMLIIPISALAQVQRQILLEHFSNASCGSCAFFNPGVQTLVDANSPNIIVLKYQVNYPGYDPMNLLNPAEVASRANYYFAGGIPFVVMDGNQYNGHAVNFNQNTIESRINDPSFFSIDVFHALSPGYDSVFVHVDINSLHAVSGAFRAFVVVVEDVINFTSPPGSNGETQFKHVMKKFLPDVHGIIIPTNFSAGQSVSIDETWPLQNIYDSTQIAIVSFVQDTLTKEVYQASYSGLLPSHSYDASLLSSENLEIELCGSSISPAVTLKNQGAIVLNNITLEYQVNNEVPQYFNWTGNLLSYQQEEIILPLYNFAPLATNQLNISANFQNPIVDQDSTDNEFIQLLDQAFESSSVVYFEMQPDSALSEISWIITNDQIDTLYESDLYTSNSLQIIQEYFELSENGCYTFSIFDTEGNGLSNGSGSGYYSLNTITGNQFISGSQFNHTKKHRFEVTDTTSNLPPWNFSATSVYHQLIFSDSLVNDLQNFVFETGDFIGAFYNNSGQWVCGGYTHYTGNTSILRCHGTVGGNPGFSPGQEFQFRLWDVSQSVELDVEATFNLLDFPNGQFFTPQGISGINGFHVVNSQIIPIPQGWSLISTFINPSESSIDSVTSTIQTNLSIVKNGTGSVFWPQFGVNAIGNIITGQAYQFKMNTADSLEISGTPVVPEQEILTIPNGWSFLGYLRQSSASIEILLSPIVSEIAIVKNGQGLVYWPLWNVNAIGNMVPGHGYQIKMNSTQNYFYPQN